MYIQNYARGNVVHSGDDHNVHPIHGPTHLHVLCAGQPKLYKKKNTTTSGGLYIPGEQFFKKCSIYENNSHTEDVGLAKMHKYSKK